MTWISRLGEEFADHSPIVLFLNARKQLGAQLLDRLRPIERQPLVLRAAGKVTRLALSFKDWFDLRLKFRICHRRC